MSSPQQTFVDAFVLLANQQPGWAWDRFDIPDDTVHRFVAPLDEFHTAFTQAHPLAEYFGDAQNDGPTIDEILQEPCVVKVEGYVVTGRRDARVTLDGVYLDNTVPIAPQSPVDHWVKTANEDDVDGSFRRLWWD